MSFSPPPNNQPPVIHVGAPQPTNVLGVVGFVLVMIGLIGMCFTPLLVIGAIGTILCLIGMFREPRGLAIAGFIVGIIEVIIGLIVVFMVGAACGGFAWTVGEVSRGLEVREQGQELSAAIEQYRRESGELPDRLSQLQVDVEARTDPWGNTIQYERTNGTFRLYSLGSDGRAGTADDIDLVPSQP